MPMTEPAYFTAFKNFEFTRTPSGPGWDTLGDPDPVEWEDELRPPD